MTCFTAKIGVEQLGFWESAKGHDLPATEMFGGCVIHTYIQTEDRTVYAKAKRTNENRES